MKKIVKKYEEWVNSIPETDGTYDKRLVWLVGKFWGIDLFMDSKKEME